MTAKLLTCESDDDANDDSSDPQRDHLVEHARHRGRLRSPLSSLTKMSTADSKTSNQHEEKSQRLSQKAEYDVYFVIHNNIIPARSRRWLYQSNSYLEVGWLVSVGWWIAGSVVHFRLSTGPTCPPPDVMNDIRW